MSKILCPVDFSDTSMNAIEFATEVAEKKRASLHLIYVFTEHEFNTIVDLEEVAKSYKELLAMADKRLKAIAREVVEEGEKKGLLECETEIALGELRDVLLNKAESGQFDMIVMGTTGLGKTMFVGSNTSWLVEKSPISVMCIPKNSTYQGFKRIVYATDIQEEDKIKIQEIVSMAILFDSRITVLHINEYQSLLEKSVINDFFKELESFLRYDKIRFDSFDYSGSLSEGLVEYMNTNSGDLMALYSQRRNFLENILHKSVSKKLSIVSERPLLVLK